ncbi:MAG: phenylalanine--tRNA ligase subunit alpha [Candidatus Aenigmatarchaeota archaeon]
MWKLTKEGEDYLINGFPEINLIKQIKEEEKLLNEIKIDNLAIALNWAKKNEWIKIENKKIILTEAGKKALKEKYKLNDALELISKTGRCPEGYLEILLNRNLIYEVKEIEKQRKFKFNFIEFIKNIFYKKQENEITQLLPKHIIHGNWKKMKFKAYDVNAPAPKIWPGKYQAYLDFLDEIKERLVSMGFVEVDGPLVESTFWNCDALFMPQDHPARGLHDIFEIENNISAKLPDSSVLEKVKEEHLKNWGGTWNKDDASKLILRSQTTAVSARVLYEHGDKPGKYFCIGRNFRPDVIDAKHLIEFQQCEGIVIGENLTFKHLLGYLKDFAHAIGMKEIKFIPSYFPFTEPSVEGYVKHPKLGWMEVLPAGILRPEVLKPLGIEKCRVLAWGIGITRLAMIKLEIDDIRHLFSNDIGFLRDKEQVIM